MVSTRTTTPLPKLHPYLEWPPLLISQGSVCSDATSCRKLSLIHPSSHTEPQPVVRFQSSDPLVSRDLSPCTASRPHRGRGCYWFRRRGAPAPATEPRPGKALHRTDCPWLPSVGLLDSVPSTWQVPSTWTAHAQGLRLTSAMSQGLGQRWPRRTTSAWRGVSCEPGLLA